jgi:23S rRNA (adenine2503-C2)-methyltransferase
MDKDLKGKTLDELEQIVVGLGQQKYLAKYIFQFAQTGGATEVCHISPLSKAFRGQLAEQGYYISQLNIIDKLTDPDGTVKYVFELADGHKIETVLLFDGSRRTLCVSTQAGCAMGCAFCATAALKLKRNLKAGEIVDQVNIVGKDETRISNVVYMGMGEPLQNYEEVVKSVRILNHPAGKNIGIRHLTISTCGIVPGIRRLAAENIRPRLSISLNAPTDVLRGKLMPINAKYPLSEVMSAAKFYLTRAKQRVTFEYVLIKGVNDTTAYAQMLVKLFRDSGLRMDSPRHSADGTDGGQAPPWRVNLIEYNPHHRCKFAASSAERIEQFSGILEKAGVKTTVRLKQGQSIKAACGQLGSDSSG